MTEAGRVEDEEAAPADDVELVASEGLAEWLVRQRVSLVFGTPPAKLWLLGVDDAGALAVFDRELDKVMGIATDAAAGTLWVATRYEIWRFENVLPAGATTDGGHDRLFVPRHLSSVGNVNIHDLGVEAGRRDLWVNTRFGCLASTSHRASFVPRWHPPFLSGPAPGDRCHLNGLATDDGRAAYVTCVSGSTEVDGWRDGRRDQGVVIDVTTGEVVVGGALRCPTRRGSTAARSGRPTPAPASWARSTLNAGVSSRPPSARASCAGCASSGTTPSSDRPSPAAATFTRASPSTTTAHQRDPEPRDRPPAPAELGRVSGPTARQRDPVPSRARRATGARCVATRVRRRGRVDPAAHRP